MTKVLNFKIVIEQDENGIFIASVPAVPGCHSQGKTYEGALKNIKEALELSLEVAKELPDYKKQVVYPEPDSKDKFLGIVYFPMRVVV